MSFRNARGAWDAWIQALPWRKPLCRTPFVIFCYARSGSYYLVDSLQTHPEITCWGELLSPGKLKQHPHLVLGPECLVTSDKLQQNITKVFSSIYRVPVQTPALGFKIMCHHSDRLYRMILRRPDIRVILVSRRNLFRQYLSTLLAHKSGIFGVLDNSQLEAYRSLTTSGVRMDPGEYQAWAGRRRLNLDKIRAQFRRHGRSCCELVYEDITGPDKLAHFNRAAAFLGVSPFTELGATKHIRQNPQHASELLQNYDEMVAALKGTAEAWMLDA